jgi:GntR family transcriptional regulator
MIDMTKMIDSGAISKKSPIPLYYQIAESLRKQIESGQIGRGEQIPPEKELEDLFGVSRTTIRQALADLTRDGLLERRRGQGTYVTSAQQQFDEPVMGIRSYTEEAAKQGFRPTTKMLAFKVLSATVEVRNELRLSEDEQVFLVKRLRLLNGDPSGVDTTYIPVRLVPALSKDDFSVEGETQSLYFILEHQYGCLLDEAEELIDATATTEEESRLLAVKNSTPINHRKRVVFLPDGTPLLYMNSVYKNRYRVRLKRRS